MTRWIAAAVAIVAAGIGGAILVPNADAQDSKAESSAFEKVRKNSEPAPLFEKTFYGQAFKPTLQTAKTTERSLPVSGSVMTYLTSAGQPGTWQIVTHKDMVLLLNTASGDTFHLRETGVGGGVKWEPIPRPEPPRPSPIPARMLPPPYSVPDGADGWPSRPDGRAEKDARPDRDKRGDERRWDDEKLADFEKAVDRIENELEEIAKKLNDAGPDEREKLRDQRRELEKKLDELEKDLREMRRGR
jgi:hypothetical protein